MRRFVLAGLLSTALTTAARTQQLRRFTPEVALGVVTYTVQDISEDGNWVAATASSRRDLLGVDHHRDGDPSYLRPAKADLWVINTATGLSRRVFSESRNVRAAAWSPDGRRLAVLATDGEQLVPTIWDRDAGRLAAVRLAANRAVAENSELRWNRAGTKILVALRSRAWKTRIDARFAAMTTGPVFVQSSDEPFLAWDDLRRQGLIRIVAAIDGRTGRIDELTPETGIVTWNLAEDDSTLVYQEDITPKTDYDVIFGTEGRLIAKHGSTPITVLGSTKNLPLVWSQNGLRFAYAKDGRLMVGSATDTAVRQIAGGKDTTPAIDTTKEAKARREKERFTPIRLSPDGQELIASNAEGIWFIETTAGARTMFLTTPDSATMAPRYAVVGWSDDRQTVLLSVASRKAWERGFARFDRRTGQLVPTIKDGRNYGAPRFSRDGSRAVFTAAEGSRPADLVVSDGDLRRATRLVETNPDLATVSFGTNQLIDYLDVDGKRQFGVVYYPPGFEAGKPYPTIFYVYESFFDDRYESIINTLTGAGYVVVQPSVSLETGYPAEGWLKGVTAAANLLIERGIADSARLGLQGISYGGYATNLLVTQTKRFKAAINISGKVDIISFYTDSPRLGVRNIHAAEKSQDRIGATLWQQPQKYVEQSAIMFADRITTPLLLMTGALDSNVPADNTREMYYALRRLGKEVVWANYMNGGHGTPATTPADFLDFHRRIIAWYDKFLSANP